MKKTLLLLLASVLPLAALAAYMNLISFNLIHAVIVGVVGVMVCALWQRRSEINALIRILVIPLPLALAFYFLIVSELPGMWVAIPTFFISALVVGIKSGNKTNSAILALSWMAVVVVGAVLIVPGIVTDDLSDYPDTAAPTFEVLTLPDSQLINNKSFEGKVIILDFFGTWCAPCITEMVELVAVKQALSNYSDQIDFYLVNNDAGGDTPEKALNFVTQRKLPFRLAYDHGGVAHQAFGFSGVPGLVIVDKDGIIRFQREGYNEAEDLESQLTEFIKLLLEA